jgi:hypothetical protein
MTDVENRAKLREECKRQILGEDVSELRSHQDVQNANFPNGDLVMKRVVINLDILLALMLN